MYISARDAAEKWSISQRRVAILCGEGRVANATMVGNMWIIPADAEKPIDARSLRYKEKPIKLKPFIKWAGGKTQLLDEIQSVFPNSIGREITKYAEPFVGGGAVLFELLSKYDFEKIYISDINKEIVNVYQVVQQNVAGLIEKLQQWQDEYVNAGSETRKIIYYSNREKFNDLIIGDKNENQIERAALFVFLNKTCFNGLYRVNRKGLYNVPMGDYKNPLICDAENLKNVSAALKNVEIVCGDYKKSKYFIDSSTLVYFDPPYRPLTKTADFTAYSENGFGDKEQKELAKYAAEMSDVGAKVVISNSDPKNVDTSDNFFDNLYSSFRIKRIQATRMINSKAENRGKISELLICNY